MAGPLVTLCVPVSSRDSACPHPNPVGLENSDRKHPGQLGCPPLSLGTHPAVIPVTAGSHMHALTYAHMHTRTAGTKTCGREVPSVPWREGCQELLGAAGREPVGVPSPASSPAALLLRVCGVKAARHVFCLQTPTCTHAEPGSCWRLIEC